MESREFGMKTDAVAYNEWNSGHGNISIIITYLNSVNLTDQSTVVQNDSLCQKHTSFQQQCPEGSEQPPAWTGISSLQIL